MNCLYRLSALIAEPVNNSIMSRVLRNSVPTQWHCRQLIWSLVRFSSPDNADFIIHHHLCRSLPRRCNRPFSRMDGRMHSVQRVHTPSISSQCTIDDGWRRVFWRGWLMRLQKLRGIVQFGRGFSCDYLWVPATTEAAAAAVDTLPVMTGFSFWPHVVALMMRRRDRPKDRDTHDGGSQYWKTLTRFH